METTGLIIGTIIFAIIQIQMFQSLPEILRNFLVRFPAIAMIINFAFSAVLISFTGATYGFGAMNMFSSVIFGFYMWHQKNMLAQKEKPKKTLI